ncbi:uncharacterized protein LOC142326799 [Lycorma delicatula]|uniref:uncharacterized protein LOC142326799 n=1 Tax=Lycorma delicatula TaxID=130591 RepID=UPI003F51A49D
MKLTLAIIFAVFSVVCVLSTKALPFYDEENFDQEPFEQLRERRSPGKGQFEFDARDERNQHGQNNRYLRGGYQQRLYGDDKGPHVDAEIHYQRNFNNKGPREEHGGSVKVTIPLGGN